MYVGIFITILRLINLFCINSIPILRKKIIILQQRPQRAVSKVELVYNRLGTLPFWELSNFLIIKLITYFFPILKIVHDVSNHNAEFCKITFFCVT